MDEGASQRNSLGKIKEWFTKFPKATWPIVTTEFGERLSYYGIKTVLVLYLWKDLQYEPDRAKAIYHAFGMLSYFVGVIGAALADSVLGKFRTIAISLLMYTVAEGAFTLTTVPSIGKRVSVGPLFALFTIALGVGTFKPTIAAFGGDQFTKTQASLVPSFFSIFYAAVNAGSMCAFLFMPIIRTDVQCFGGDCYSLVFGVNAIVIFLTLVVFLVCKKWYRNIPQETNIVVKFFNIVARATRNRITGQTRNSNYKHWLDRAQDKYEVQDIEDVKKVLRVLVLYIPLPVWWALFHQQGSSWTLQAEQMDGDLGKIGRIRSDQMQVLNPVLALFLIPLCDGVIYPLLEKCGISLSSLKKMAAGMLLAGVAFAISGLVQIQIQDVSPNPTVKAKDMTAVQFVNVAPCDLALHSDRSLSQHLEEGQFSEFTPFSAGRRSIMVKGKNCSGDVQSVNKSFNVVFKENGLFTVVLGLNENNQLYLKKVPVNIPSANKQKAETRVRFFYFPASNFSPFIEVHLIGEKTYILNLSENHNKYHEINPGEYDIKIVDQRARGNVFKITMKKKIKFNNFGAVTVVLKAQVGHHNDTLVSVYDHKDVPGTFVSRLMQFPQYIALTAAEVMFVIPGLDFSYSQAPSSMKSVVQAFWLLTWAFGDLIVLILAEVKPVKGMESEMFLYGGLMVVVTIFFAVLAHFYKYLPTPQGDEEERNNEISLAQCERDNHSQAS